MINDIHSFLQTNFRRVEGNGEKDVPISSSWRKSPTAKGVAVMHKLPKKKLSKLQCRAIHKGRAIAKEPLTGPYLIIPPSVKVSETMLLVRKKKESTMVG